MANLIEILANKAVNHCAIHDETIRAQAVEQTVTLLRAVDDRRLASGAAVVTWDDKEHGKLAGIVQVSIAQVDVVTCNAHDGHVIGKVRSFAYCTMMDEIDEMGENQPDPLQFNVPQMINNAQQLQAQLV